VIRALLAELERWEKACHEADMSSRDAGTWMVGERAWPSLRDEWARQFSEAGKYVEATRTRALGAPPAGAMMFGLPVMEMLVPDSEDVVIAVVPPELDPRVKRILTGRA
jgi:hypothetical protein